MGRKLARHVPLEDAVQDVWTRALDSLPRFEWQGKGSFFRWLGGIADNVVKNHARRHLGTPRGTECSLEVLGTGNETFLVEDRRLGKRGTTPSRTLQREERLARLETALEKLLPDHREVILLARLQGLRILEVAQRMDRTPEAVRSLLRRALQELQREFGDTESLGLPDRSFEPTVRGALEGSGSRTAGDEDPSTGNGTEGSTGGEG
jgi:RNA polymerase sigma-70 factor, ECF subfamily